MHSGLSIRHGFVVTPHNPPIFQSPVLSDTLATFDSHSTTTTKAGASLLRSFCDVGAPLPMPSPCSATSPHLTPRPPTLPSALSAPPPASTTPAPFFAASPPPPPPVLPDVFTYNFLIRRLARFHPVSSVYAFIDELRRSSGIRPDLVTYTILIDAVCRRRNLRESTRLLGMLSDAGNISHLNAVVLGESLASEENDLVFPSLEFSAQALVSSPK